MYKTKYNSMMDKTLKNLGYETYLALAEYHEKQALIFKSWASRIENTTNEDFRIKKELHFLDNIHHVVMKFLRRGYSLKQAFEMTCEHTDVLLPTIKQKWHNFMRAKFDDEKIQRNHFIVELANLNYTNEQISKLVNLHKNSVSRILSAERKKRDALIKKNDEKHPYFENRKRY